VPKAVIKVAFGTAVEFPENDGLRDVLENLFVGRNACYIMYE
jgi:hypothetical protein